MVDLIPNAKAYMSSGSIFRIGKVIEIFGQSVKVKVDKGKNTSSVLYNGELIQNISVGGYVKISKGFEELIGKIEGESVIEDRAFLQSPYSSNKERIHRILNIKILGFILNGVFNRGIKDLPLIENTCYLLSKAEFNKIHDFTRSDDAAVEIGSLEYDSGQKIKLGINSLFASHIGIFGNTGSGKSYTLAKIYKELFDIYKDNINFQKNAKFILIDFNGEYIGEVNKSTNKYLNKNVIIDDKYKNIYELTTGKKIEDIKDKEKFPIRKSTLEDPVFWSIFLSATEKTQKPFIDRAIKDSYINDHLADNVSFQKLIYDKIIAATSVSGKNVDRGITVDLISEIGNFLNCESLKNSARYFTSNLAGGNENITFHIEQVGVKRFAGSQEFNDLIKAQTDGFTDIDINNLSIIRKFGLRIIIKYYDDIIRGFSNKDHLAPLIKRLDKRVFDLEKVLTVKNDSSMPKNFTIVSLKDVNLDIRKMIPMLLVKELYDEKKRNNNKNHSLHIIIDEAHNILSQNSDREAEQWKDYRLETFEEVIKEGRKFGTFLTIASQRPSDISPTIISQLHNYFLHRLINNNDLLAVEKTIAYLDKVSADSIPSLATGTCILAGLIAQIPVVMRINKIEKKEQEPQGHNINLLEKWKIHT
ncbi:MAG: ATP-binding protein [Candidatus Gracilibacteria bacterium]